MKKEVNKIKSTYIEIAREFSIFIQLNATLLFSSKERNEEQELS